jgi:serine/threonine protein phosphatase 1
MRTLAIGDIHGCLRALDTLLAEVRPQPDDLVITLGDYVDRGPDSKGVIDRLLELSKTLHLVCLRGNHDFMMQGARYNYAAQQEWLLMGGKETLASYSNLPGGGRLNDVSENHWEFLDRRCVNWHETERHFFVHADADPQLPLADQSEYILHWKKLTAPKPHQSGKIMICGHTSQKSGKPRNWGHAICIDTYVYGDGWLTCLDIDTGQIWQANQQGESRTSMLSPPHW